MLVPGDFFCEISSPRDLYTMTDSDSNHKVNLCRSRISRKGMFGIKIRCLFTFKNIWFCLEFMIGHSNYSNIFIPITCSNRSLFKYDSAIFYDIFYALLCYFCWKVFLKLFCLSTLFPVCLPVSPFSCLSPPFVNIGV